MCNFWIIFVSDQVSCPNMGISKIGPYVNEPRFYTGAFALLVFKVILGVIWCICLKMACNSKTGVRGEKRSEIWKSVVTVNMCMGTFDLLVFKII